MFYITGDTHIPIDFDKLRMENFPLSSSLSKKDYLIICGDFGAIWDDSPKRLECISYLSDSPFTTLFIDGNHENFDMLYRLPVSQWCGGKVHFIRDTVIHLMRGQVFNIDGTKFFTMGGGYSLDRYHREEGVSWWPEEMPSKYDYEQARRNLQDNSNSVDFIISHTCPSMLTKYFGSTKFPPENPESELNSFLQLVYNNVSFKKWFFGHMHADMILEERFFAIYDNIRSLPDGNIVNP